MGERADTYKTDMEIAIEKIAKAKFETYCKINGIAQEYAKETYEEILDLTKSEFYCTRKIF